MAGPDTNRDDAGAPTRLVLQRAEAQNRDLGHENLGFLSESHGFMPIRPPLTSLPASHAAWDELVADLPRRFRTMSLRRDLETLPVLGAAEAELPDEFLLRASSILSILAHAYHRIQPDLAGPTPPSIQSPWETVTRRLGRSIPILSYIDLIMYNWRLEDPERDPPMRLANLRLLVPTVGNREEEIFYLTQVEILGRSSPVVGALVRAQEAILRDDPEGVGRELIAMMDTLHEIMQEALPQIDPNPSSDTFVDPVIWARTVAPMAVPLDDRVQGPSGTSAPVFSALDVFFGRRDYASTLGKEVLHIREMFPVHWRDFLGALARTTLADYLARCDNRTLHGLHREALATYAGDAGFLGRHRLKVYGFLEIAFKAGRIKTIGGFEGRFSDRTWDEVDDELADSKRERGTDLVEAWHPIEVKEVAVTHVDGSEWVKHVILDVSDTGIRYLPGDRCFVLPENRPELVQRTLDALRASGDEMITLNRAWREAVLAREGYEAATGLPLRVLLRFGRIRPVTRDVAEHLLAMTGNGTLRAVLRAGTEDQWELWDLLGMLTESGFEPRLLWSAQNPAERDSVCWIVPPESPRMYSISSAMEDDRDRSAKELHLTVGELRYTTRASDVTRAAERLGTGSSFLGEARGRDGATPGTRLSLRVVRPPRFSLPTDADAPVVMFAGGTGISPFRGFVLARARQGCGENWLFFGARTREEFYYEEELYELSTRGNLHLRAVFSREDMIVRTDPEVAGGRFVMEPGRRQHVDDEILNEDNARRLWDLLRGMEEGGRGARIYICGRTGFANTILAALHRLFVRFETEAVDAESAARQRLYRLVAERRLMMDVFTTYSGAKNEGRQQFPVSDLVLRNGEPDGMWMAISGRIYDLDEFMRLHPGGLKVLRSYLGMDATEGYQRVLHHVNPEVDSMLGLYEIGALKRPDLGNDWTVLLSRRGLRLVSLTEAYDTWVRAVFLVVEMENALRNGYTILEGVMTRGEAPGAPSVYRAQYVLEVHRRFIREYAGGLAGDPMQDIWAVTAALCDPGADIRWMHGRLQAIADSDAAHAVQKLTERLDERVTGLALRGDVEPGDPVLVRLFDRFAKLEAPTRQFMHDMKMTLRSGVQVFEQCGRTLDEDARSRLLEITRRIPGHYEAWYAAAAKVEGPRPRQLEASAD